MHNTIEDQSQRPLSSRGGGIYSYEAIAPRQEIKPPGMGIAIRIPGILATELRIRASLSELERLLGANWWKKLNGAIELGRSKKDDYGHVQLEVGTPIEISIDTASAPSPTSSPQTLVVWVVSDLLLRNARLRHEPTPECLARELTQLLGVSVRWPSTQADEQNQDTLRKSQQVVLKGLARTRRLESWHVGWGLPRPSLLAIQAGSCFVFEVQGPIDPRKLTEVELRGVGERTAEGYGQLLFNHPFLTESADKFMDNHIPQDENFLRSWLEGLKSAPPSAPILDPQQELYGLAAWIEEESWREEIQRRCLYLASDPKQRECHLGWITREGSSSPPLSQLGALREQVSRIKKAADVQDVLDWLEHLEKTQRRRDKWPQLHKVKTLLKDKQFIWKILHECNIPSHDGHQPANSQWLRLTNRPSEQIQEQLWAYALRIFFEACIRQHKRQSESLNNL
ncbi:MAG: hypothetical protein KatS3mg113_1047 [Planctomycetaceae bacterium]|nr:MAG: hypothetical protein KatS3mg113_1047 [Planctomycetaceae bacterium]